jgi:hypothetical protein
MAKRPQQSDALRLASELIVRDCQIIGERWIIRRRLQLPQTIGNPPFMERGAMPDELARNEVNDSRQLFCLHDERIAVPQARLAGDGQEQQKQNQTATKSERQHERLACEESGESKRCQDFNMISMGD